MARTIDSEPATEPARAPHKPQRIGEFTIVDELGAGGMGRVYTAHDADLDRHVAIKVLHPCADANAQQARNTRFLREAQGLARVSHPNVVAVYEIGVDDGAPFIVMELVNGGSLRQWQRDEHDWQDVVRIYAQAGRGITACHDAQLVHRDIKPDNILMDDTMRPRVSDFGLVGAVSATDGRDARDLGLHGPLSATLTNAGDALGTLAYMPPEQLCGEAVDARADQFAFAVALYEALHGERPFAGTSVPALLNAITTGSYKAMRDDLPLVLRDGLSRALSAKREQRFESLDGLLHILDTVVVVPPPRRRWLLPIVVTCAAAVALTIIATTGLLVRSEMSTSWATNGASCDDAVSRLTGVWDTERKRKLAAAFVQHSGRNVATATLVSNNLDSYAASWARDYDAACVASSHQRTQTSAQFQLRASCYEAARRKLADVSQILVAADARVVGLAMETVATLVPLSRCQDIRGLAKTFAIPSSAVVAARVVESRTLVNRSEALHAAGKTDHSVEVALSAVSVARRSGDKSALVRAQLRAGAAYFHAGATTLTIRTFDEASLLAKTLGDNRSQLLATFGAMRVFSYLRIDKKRARALVEQSRLLLATLTGVLRQELQVRFELELSYVEELDNDTGAASRRIARACALRRKVSGDDDLQLADCLARQGELAWNLDELAIAVRAHREAHAILTKRLGPQAHVTSIMAAWLGRALLAQGDVVEAKRLIEMAYENTHLSMNTHSEFGRVLHALALVRAAQGKWKQAATLIERGMRLLERESGRASGDVADLMESMAEIAVEQGNLDHAVTLARRVVAMRTSSVGKNHLWTMTARFLVATVYVQGKRLNKAIVELTSLLETLVRVHGASHHYTAYPLVLLAEIYLTKSKADPRRALKYLLRASPLIVRAPSFAVEYERRHKQALLRARQRLRAR